jgi:hypothetical protein
MRRAARTLVSLILGDLFRCPRCGERVEAIEGIIGRSDPASPPEAEPMAPADSAAELASILDRYMADLQSGRARPRRHGGGV